jgi:hypothetical protein
MGNYLGTSRFYYPKDYRILQFTKCRLMALDAPPRASGYLALVGERNVQNKLVLINRKTPKFQWCMSKGVGTTVS